MTAEEITIRAVHELDLPQLAEAIREHAHYERANEVRADLETALRPWLLSPHPRVHVLVAVHGKALIGYASWSLEASTWRAAEYAHLDCLYLRDNYRGRGVGRALMDAVEAAAQTIGASELQWQTPQWNADAIRFYRRTGAREAPKIRFAREI